MRKKITKTLTLRCHSLMRSLLREGKRFYVLRKMASGMHPIATCLQTNHNGCAEKGRASGRFQQEFLRDG